MQTNDSRIKNSLYDQIYVSAVEIDGVMYHARQEGEEIKVVVDAHTKLPIPVWVCICHAKMKQDCTCGAWDMYLDVVDDWTGKELYLPPKVKEEINKRRVYD